MRVIFTTYPASGHFWPMVPLARELKHEGHELAFCVSGDLARIVTDLGFAAIPVHGLTHEEMVEEGNRRGPARESLIRTERWRFGASIFAYRAAAFVEPLTTVLDQWRPDVIVHEPAEFAAAIAGQRRDVPHVTHSWGGPREWQWGQLRSELMTPVWEKYGLAPAANGGDYEYLYLDICPPSLRYPPVESLVNVQLLRPDSPWSVTRPNDWLAQKTGVRTLYLTLGTMPANNTETYVLSLLVEGLARLDVNVIVTVGANNDPHDIGAPPPNVRIERYIRQDDLMPSVETVVCHGGSGTMFGALRHGIPLLLAPLGADHFQNAAACIEAGVARFLDVDSLTPDVVVSEASAVLEGGSYRERAGMIRQEIDAMPGPDVAVRRISELVGR
jgi:UDP:flavonoid glycosyltransferase YjiC (YdhE family)